MSSGMVKTTKRLVNGRTLITGKSANTELKSVQVNKLVEIFESRLSPDTECDDLFYVQNIAPINDVHIVDINCVKLPSKFNSHSSFHITIWFICSQSINVDISDDILVGVLF